MNYKELQNLINSYVDIVKILISGKFVKFEFRDRYIKGKTVITEICYH